MGEIKKREDTRWVIYKNLLSSMLVIENNRKKPSNCKSDMTYYQISIIRENRDYIKSLHT